MSLPVLSSCCWVRNEAYNYLKSEFHKINRAELSDTLESSAVLRPDHIAYLEEITSRIQYIIERLPLQCRKVFLLSRYEGKKYQSIAEELNISIKTVEAHISKALITAQKGILLGVTRRAVLRIARGQGMSIEYRSPLINEQFDEAFLTSSSRGVVPIVKIDGKPVGRGKPGAGVRQYG